MNNRNPKSSTSKASTPASRSKFVHDILSLAFGQFLGKVLGFFAFAYLATSLGPTAYGSIEFAASLGMFFALIVDCGLGAIGVRELGKDSNRLQELASLIPAARLLIVFIVMPTMMLIALLAGLDRTTVFLVWLFAGSLIAAPWKQLWLLQANDKMFLIAFAEIIHVAVLFLGFRWLVNSPNDLLWVGAVKIAAVGCMTGFLVIYQQFFITPVRFRFVMKEIFAFLREGLSIGLSNMVWGFHQYSPVLLIAILLAGEATGLFGAAHRLVVSLLTFSFIYHFNLFPELARRAGKSMDALKELLLSSFRVVAWTSCLLTTLFVLSSRSILVLLYDESYTEASTALAILAAILPITILGGHARWALISLGHQRFVLRSQIAGAIVMAIIGPPCILWIGPIGASIAMALACLSVWLFAHWYSIQVVGYSPSLLVAIKPITLGLIISIVGVSSEQNLVLQLVGAVFAFTIALALLDRNFLTSIRHLVDSKSVAPA